MSDDAKSPRWGRFVCGNSGCDPESLKALTTLLESGRTGLKAFSLFRIDLRPTSIFRVTKNSAFLNKSQHFTVHLFRSWRPGSARQRRRPPTVHRGSTHAPRLQRPVASEDEASACSELRLVVTRKRPSLNRASAGMDWERGEKECPVACESEEREPAVMEKCQNKANFALALVYEWFAVRTHNGDIELGKQSRFGRLVVGGSQVDRDRMSQGP